MHNFCRRYKDNQLDVYIIMGTKSTYQQSTYRHKRNGGTTYIKTVWVQVLKSSVWSSNVKQDGDKVTSVKIHYTASVLKGSTICFCSSVCKNIVSIKKPYHINKDEDALDVTITCPPIMWSTSCWVIMPHDGPFMFDSSEQTLCCNDLPVKISTWVWINTAITLIPDPGKCFRRRHQKLKAGRKPWWSQKGWSREESARVSWTPRGMTFTSYHYKKSRTKTSLEVDIHSTILPFKKTNP
jgi:hypothetical protein